MNPESREAFCRFAQALTALGKAEEARAYLISACQPSTTPNSRGGC